MTETEILAQIETTRALYLEADEMGHTVRAQRLARRYEKLTDQLGWDPYL